MPCGYVVVVDADIRQFIFYSFILIISSAKFNAFFHHHRTDDDDDDNEVPSSF